MVANLSSTTLPRITVDGAGSFLNLLDEVQRRLFRALGNGNFNPTAVIRSLENYPQRGMGFRPTFTYNFSYSPLGNMYKWPPFAESRPSTDAIREEDFSVTVVYGEESSGLIMKCANGAFGDRSVKDVAQSLIDIVEACCSTPEVQLSELEVPSLNSEHELIDGHPCGTRISLCATRSVVRQACHDLAVEDIEISLDGNNAVVATLVVRDGSPPAALDAIRARCAEEQLFVSGAVVPDVIRIENLSP